MGVKKICDTPFNPKLLDAEVDVGLEHLDGPRLGLDDHPGQLDEDIRELGGGRDVLLPLLDLAVLNFWLADVVDDQPELGELLSDGGHVAQGSGHHVEVKRDVVLLQDSESSLDVLPGQEVKGLVANQVPDTNELGALGRPVLELLDAGLQLVVLGQVKASHDALDEVELLSAGMNPSSLLRAIVMNL